MKITFDQFERRQRERQEFREDLFWMCMITGAFFTFMAAIVHGLSWGML